MGPAVAGGARVAELRKARGITQAALARRTGISVSLLSKIEVGDRTLTPGVAAAIARALQISLGALYGEAEISAGQSVLLENLRTAVRRYDIPDQAPHAGTFLNCVDFAGGLAVVDRTKHDRSLLAVNRTLLAVNRRKVPLGATRVAATGPEPSQ